MTEKKEEIVDINFISFTKSGMRLAGRAVDSIERFLTDAVKNATECAACSGKEYRLNLYTKYKGAAETCKGKTEIETDAGTEGYRDKGTSERKTIILTEDMACWVGRCFQNKEPLIFVGACGIAVRAIAPFVRDKLSDIPVLVMDEKGQFVIPILSGHYGGANELANMVAAAVGATPVITTATDVNQLFAVDVFARKNEFILANRQNIARVSGKILEQKITMQICGNYQGEVPGEVEIIKGKSVAAPGKSGAVPKEIEITEEKSTVIPDVLVAPRQWFKEECMDQILHLIPRVMVLGMGCRKGKDPKELEHFVLRQLKCWRIPIEAVKALATIDRKKEELAFRCFAEKYHVEFLVFHVEQLCKIAGEFESSDFVKRQVGVDNVCERAAVCGAGKNGKLYCRKAAENGMTLAVAECDWRAVF